MKDNKMQARNKVNLESDILIISTNDLFLIKTTNFSGKEATGFSYLFEDDSEISLDMSGKIIDYSGMGYERANRYSIELN